MPRRDHVNPYKRYDPKKRDYSNGVTVPPAWAGWVRTFRNQFVRIMDRPKEEGQTPVVVLYINSGMQRGMAIRLTDLTEKEVQALKSFLDETIDLALPIIRLRDGRSNELADAGLDDHDGRIDRVFPEVVTRSWARGIDSASILQRLAYLPGRDGNHEPEDDEPGDDGTGLAEYNQGGIGTPDDVEAIVLD